MELQMFLDNAQADLATAREQLDSMETEHKELANEYIALKTSHVQLTADYQKEVGTTTTFCAVLCFNFILNSQIFMTSVTDMSTTVYNVKHNVSVF